MHLPEFEQFNRHKTFVLDISEVVLLIPFLVRILDLFRARFEIFYKYLRVVKYHYL